MFEKLKSRNEHEVRGGRFRRPEHAPSGTMPQEVQRHRSAWVAEQACFRSKRGVSTLEPVNQSTGTGWPQRAAANSEQGWLNDGSRPLANGAAMGRRPDEEHVHPFHDPRRARAAAEEAPTLGDRDEPGDVIVIRQRVLVIGQRA